MPRCFTAGCLLWLSVLATAVSAAEPGGPGAKIFIRDLHTIGDYKGVPDYGRFVKWNRMCRVTGAELAAAGVDLSLFDARACNLVMGGRPRPVWIENAGPDGRVTPATVFKFYGAYPVGRDGEKSIETTDNVYYLVNDASLPPVRFAYADADPATTGTLGLIKTQHRVNHVERDVGLVHFQLPNSMNSTRTMWNNEIRIENDPKIEPNKIWIPDFYFSDLSPSEQFIDTKIMLVGMTYLPAKPDHKWNVIFNFDYNIGEAVWDGREPFAFTGKIPVKALARRADFAEFEFTPGKDGQMIDSMVLDWVEFSYLADLRPVRDFIECNLEAREGAWTVELAPSFTSEKVDVFDLDRNLKLGGAVFQEGAGWGCRFARPFAGKPARIVAAAEGGYFGPAAIEPYKQPHLDSMEAPQYLVISHRDFIKPMQKLVEYRGRHGLKSALVDIGDVYDQYSHGLLTGAAIRDFVAGLARRAPKDAPLKYVLLVGTTTDDYSDTAGDAAKRKEINWMPTLFRDNDTGSTLDYAPIFACDDLFATRPGEKKPFLAVGRLPVSAESEASGFVDKVIAFEESLPKAPKREGWMDRAVLISAENFSGEAEGLRKHLEGERTWDFSKNYAEHKDYAVYMQKDQEIDILKRKIADFDKPPAAGAAKTTPEAQAAARAKLAGLQKEVDAFRAENNAMQASIVAGFNKGAALVYFVGHGSRGMWRTGSAMDSRNETDMFNSMHIAKLQNLNQYPIVFTATCFSCIFGKSDQPNMHAGIGPQLVMAPGRGAIAAVGHVGKTTTWPPTAFTQEVCDYLTTSGTRTLRLGDAFFAAKKKMAGNSMIDGIALIGDPATRMDYFAGAKKTGDGKTAPKATPKAAPKQAPKTAPKASAPARPVAGRNPSKPPRS